jgi:ribosomal small subunit protein bTHX
MGKGDMRTRRGKINRGTNGKTRPKKTKVKSAEKAVPEAAVQASE